MGSFSTENPIGDEDDYRLEVLIALRRVERLDKDEYNEDERQEAQDIYEQRRQDELAAEVCTFVSTTTWGDFTHFYYSINDWVIWGIFEA